MGDTGIPYADKVWNPVRGCSHLSAGCANCWAAELAHRFSGPGLAFERLTRSTSSGPRWVGVARVHREKLDEPLQWRTPQTVFVCSMSDLFHDSVPLDFIAAVYGVMAACPQHTFLVFTKRTHRMREFFEWIVQQGSMLPGLVGAEAPDGTSVEGSACIMLANLELRPHPIEPKRLARALQNAPWPLPNVVHVASCENQETAVARIPDLMLTPGAYRYVSLEPLLAPVDLGSVQVTVAPGFFGSPLQWHHKGHCHELDGTQYPKLDGVIVGGESGRRARTCRIEWIESLVEQVRSLPSVKLYVKQLGSWPAMIADGSKGHWDYPFDLEKTLDLNDSAGADPLEWPEHLRIRDFEKVRVTE